MLLNLRKLLKRHFNTQISAGNHDALNGFEDFAQIVNAFFVLNLGDDADILAAVFIEQGAKLAHIIGITAEAGGNIVHLVLNTEKNVCSVTLGNVGHIQAQTGDVDTLAAAESALVEHGADDITIIDFINSHCHKAVINEDAGANAHILGQACVVHADLSFVAVHFSGGESETLAFVKGDFTATVSAGADFGTLGVQHQSNRL